jgi:hypothetical protein
MKKFFRNFTLQMDEKAESAILDKHMLGKYSMEYNLTIGDDTLMHGHYRLPRTLDLRSI